MCLHVDVALEAVGMCYLHLKIPCLALITFVPVDAFSLNFVDEYRFFNRICVILPYVAVSNDTSNLAREIKLT